MAPRTTPRGRAFGSTMTLGLTALLGLTACGSQSSSGASSAAPPTTTVGSTPGTPGTSTSPSPPKSSPGGSTSSSPGDITLTGTVEGEGLTCVRFAASNGHTYALSGPGLPGKVIAVAHSRGRRSTLDTQPSSGQSARITVVGHPVAHAMSTCSATVFSVSSTTVHSISGG